MLRGYTCALLLALWFLAVSELVGLAQATRTSDGLQVLYEFDEAHGELVHDQSGVGTPVDLTIADPQKSKWSRGFLRLQNETVLRSSGAATKVIEAVQKTHAVTVEAWVKPNSTSQTGPARIVSLSADPSNRNVTLGQQADTWELRLRTSATSANGIPALSTKNGTLKAELVHVVSTHDAQGTTTIYVNGKSLIREETKGDLSNWDPAYPLLIANEVTGDRAWLGELHLVAIYDKALSPDEVQQNFVAGTKEQSRIAELLPPALSRPVDFVRDVQPIFRQHCYECHAAANEEGGLNLAIKARALEGGEHGTVLVRGNSQSSLLVHLVSGVEPERLMPPEDNESLSREQIGALRAWIDQGAEWPSEADVLDPRLEAAHANIGHFSDCGRWCVHRLGMVTSGAVPISMC